MNEQKLVEQELKNMIVKACRIRIRADKICETTNLMLDLGFDSLALMQLIVDIEAYFGFTFKDEELAIDHLIIYNNLLQKICASIDHARKYSDSEITISDG